jgi:hypothetical protein
MIPPLLLIHLSRSEECDNHDQAAHCHIFGLKDGTSSLNRHLNGYRVRKLSLFEVLTAVTTKDTVFWDVMPFSPVE